MSEPDRQPAFIKVTTDAPDHYKIGMLQRRLGISENEAFGAVVRLWAWLPEHTSSGRLEITPQKLVAVMKLYEVDPPTLIDTLVDVGLIDRDDDGLVVHDWTTDKNTGAFLEMQRKKAVHANHKKHDNYDPECEWCNPSVAESETPEEAEEETVSPRGSPNLPPGTSGDPRAGIQDLDPDLDPDPDSSFDFVDGGVQGGKETLPEDSDPSPSSDSPRRLGEQPDMRWYYECRGCAAVGVLDQAPFGDSDFPECECDPPRSHRELTREQYLRAIDPTKRVEEKVCASCDQPEHTAGCPAKLGMEEEHWKPRTK